MSSRASSASFANGSPFGPTFEGELSPEDLFNMFFGGGGMGGGVDGGCDQQGAVTRCLLTSRLVGEVARVRDCLRWVIGNYY